MLAIGIIITIVAILMLLFPESFMKMKSPGLSQKVRNSPKMKMITRIWAGICGGIGIALIVLGII